jgi:hypothetical protein
VNWGDLLVGGAAFLGALYAIVKGQRDAKDAKRAIAEAKAEKAADVDVEGAKAAFATWQAIAEQYRQDIAERDRRQDEREAFWEERLNRAAARETVLIHEIETLRGEVGRLSALLISNGIDTTVARAPSTITPLAPEGA